jgi:hypothetical protein
MLSTPIHRLHDLFQLIRFSPVFDIQADEASAILFGVPLFVVTKRVLHSKTWLEHCILAEVGVCYRSLGEVETVRAWGSLR